MLVDVLTLLHLLLPACRRIFKLPFCSPRLLLPILKDQVFKD